jgi:hypothetical protein
MSETNEKEWTWEDHLAAAIKSFRMEMKEHRSDWLPGEFHEHHRAARREMLLAWRSLIDTQIQKLEKADGEKSAPQVARIKVE